MDHLPSDEGGEVIMIGYSNVGKSSVINTLANEKNLAKCSKTPGRTQLFNIFDLNQNSRIIDLPGYGFAKTPKKTQQAWMHNLQNYLSQRQCLKGIVLITDIRRGLRPIDEDILGWAQQHHIPALIILNKSDKLSKNDVKKAKVKIVTLYNIPEESLLVFSCTKKIGIPEAISQINAWLGVRS